MIKRVENITNRKIRPAVVTITPRSNRYVNRDDAKLIANCLDGDQSAWNELVERYGRLVYSIPRRYGLDDAASEDVFQGVFVTLFRSLDSLRDPQRLSAWLITCAHRESWRVGKKTNRHAHLNEAIVDVGSPGDDEIERWEHQHIVRRALRTLGGPCEKLLTALFMCDGQPNYQTIASQLDMPVGSIGPTRARCFTKLKPILTQLGLSPEAQAEPAEAAER